MTSPLSPHRSRLKSFFRYLMISLVAVGLGLFLARKEIGNALAEKLEERLFQAGIFVTWQSAYWIPGPGIKLHQLALYRDAKKLDRLALLGNVSAIKEDPEWSVWDKFQVKILNADLTLDHGLNETKLENLNLQLGISPGKVVLDESDALLDGLRIKAKGFYLLNNPSPPSNINIPESATTSIASPNQGLFSDVNLDWLPTFKKWLNFQAENEVPVLSIELNSTQKSNNLDLLLALDGKNFNWRGQKWDLLNADVKTLIGDSSSPIQIKNVQIGHGGKIAKFKGTYDSTDNVLRIGNLDSKIDLLALVRSLVPSTTKSLSTINTTGDWQIIGQGEIPFDHPENRHWKGNCSLNGKLLYSSSGTEIALQNPIFAMQMEKQVISIANLNADIWDGNLNMPSMQIHLPTPKTNSKFETEFSLNKAKLQSVMNSFGTTDKQPGIVNFNWKGVGEFDRKTIIGSGNLDLSGAEFFRIPLLGSLTTVFDKLTSGFDETVSSNLTLNHRIANDILHIKKLKFDSSMTSIRGDGTIDLSKQHTHLTAKVKLRGIVGIATALVSTLLEVEGEGPVDNVRWSLKNIPGSGLIGDATVVVGKTGGAIVDGAGSAVNTVGNATKDIVKYPGKLFRKEKKDQSKKPIPTTPSP